VAVVFDSLAAGSYDIQAHGQNGTGAGAESAVATVDVT
jgi:hypothetical protein